MSNRLFVLALLAIGSVCGANAVAEESPALEIVSAVYGDLPDGAKVDVTDKVKKELKDGKLRLEVCNDLLGDPAEQKGKTLLVQYKLGGEVRETKIDEGDLLLLPRPKLKGALKITKAEYGDIANGQVYNVTSDLQSRIKNGSIEMEVNNDSLGDPASGVFKTLRVVYMIGDTELVKRVYEGGTLKLSEPKPE